jgi:hypothetical protein
VRALVGGIIGGFLGVLLLAGGLVAVMGVRAATGPSQKDRLLKSLDAFEQWYDQDGPAFQYYRNQCSSPTYRNPSLSPDTSRAPCVSYKQRMDQFLTQYPELKAYLAWLVDVRLQTAGKGLVGPSRARNPSFEDMRDPAMLDRFFAERR